MKSVEESTETKQAWSLHPQELQFREGSGFSARRLQYASPSQPSSGTGTESSVLSMGEASQRRGPFPFIPKLMKD